MLPLRDDIPSKRFPVLTVAIIVANVAVFLFELKQGPELGEFLFAWGFVPERYTDARIAASFTLGQHAAPFLTSMFLHGGWMHLFGNMWTLWIFGDNVEDRLGRVGFVALYLVGGFVATLLHLITNAHSPLPTIGASGAVAAVMGAYFRLYPRARVHTVILPFVWFVFELPAVVFLGWWFLLQFFSGAVSLADRSEHVGGVAWWAHIGGFAFGLIVALFLRDERPRRRRAQWDEEDSWRR